MYVEVLLRRRGGYRASSEDTEVEVREAVCWASCKVAEARRLSRLEMTALHWSSRRTEAALVDMHGSLDTQWRQAEQGAHCASICTLLILSSSSNSLTS